jgi:N6-L-threonylcarbamoyladenine synthase
MKILSIETSCDESGFSLIEANGDLSSLRFKIIKEEVATQIKIHREYGGVVPVLARREHEKNLPILFEKFEELDELNPDILSVTVGPGLDPCLWSGINYTEEIHKNNFSKISLLGANHLEGHLYSFLLDEKFKKEDNVYEANNLGELFPMIALVVSGGHTMIIYMKSMTEWEKLGETRDDAVGEAFDKVARLLDLPYPGGPEIERVSKENNKELINFPSPMLHSKDYDFSYSGLKTSILYYVRDNKDLDKSNVAHSFQEAAFKPLVKKCERAVQEFGAKSIILSGGVAANKTLQNKLKDLSENIGTNFFVGPLKYNTDNATIISVATYINYLSGKEYKLESQPNLSL